MMRELRCRLELVGRSPVLEFGPLSAPRACISFQTLEQDAPFGASFRAACESFSAGPTDKLQMCVLSKLFSESLCKSYRADINILFLGDSSSCKLASYNAVVLLVHVANYSESGATVPFINETVGRISYPCLLDSLNQKRNYQRKRKPNPYGKEASENFASNANYGEDGCIYCDHGKCTLKVGDLEQQPKYRTSPSGNFPCLYCDAEFSYMENLILHQLVDHSFLFCPRSPSTTCDVCANTYRGKEDDHDCPSPANK